jgi:hypothetical protein
MSFVCVFFFLVCFVVVNALAEGGLTPHRELETGALCLGSTEFDDLLGRIEALAPTGSFPEGECENGHIGCGENQYQVNHESGCPGDASKKCSKCAACPEGTTTAAGCTMDGKEACLPPPPLSADDLVDIIVITNWFDRHYYRDYDDKVAVVSEICNSFFGNPCTKIYSTADEQLVGLLNSFTQVHLIKTLVSHPGDFVNQININVSPNNDVFVREFSVRADCTIDFRVNGVDMTYEEIQSGTTRHPYNSDTDPSDMSVEYAQFLKQQREGTTQYSVTLNDYTMLIPDKLHFRLSITIDDPRCRASPRGASSSPGG